MSYWQKKSTSILLALPNRATLIKSNFTQRCSFFTLSDDDIET